MRIIFTTCFNSSKIKDLLGWQVENNHKPYTLLDPFKRWQSS
jgi:hypothetical protein